MSVKILTHNFRGYSRISRLCSNLEPNNTHTKMTTNQQNKCSVNKKQH